MLVPSNDVMHFLFIDRERANFGADDGGGIRHSAMRFMVYQELNDTRTT